MKIKLFLSAAICLSLSNTTFANNVGLCATKCIAGLYTEAVPYCEKNCNLGDGLGCTALGDLYAKGQGVKQNYQQAKTYYEKACNLGNGLGCAVLGALYYEGRGVKQNKRTAKEYNGKACDLGVQLGCDGYRALNEQGY